MDNDLQEDRIQLEFKRIASKDAHPSIFDFLLLIERLLAPMFPDAKITIEQCIDPQKDANLDEYRILSMDTMFDAKVQTRRQLLNVVARNNNKIVYVFDPTLQDIAIRFRRRIAFSATSLKLLCHFQLCCKELKDLLYSPLLDEQFNLIMSEIVAKAVSEESSRGISYVISLLSRWSQRNYEGHSITSCFGIVNNKLIYKSPGKSNKYESINVSNISESDYLKVLTNGLDTMLTISNDLELISHENLTKYNSARNSCPAPIRFINLAEWSSRTDGIAIALTRARDILIFHMGCLSFARRRGIWHYFAHNLYIGPILRTVSRENKSQSNHERAKQIYLSTLDAAFSLSGACIGIFEHGSAEMLDEILTEKQLLSDKNKKSATLQKIIGERKFTELDRNLRLELLSIDGATIINYDGTILAVGAILKPDVDSHLGGGREAAARTLAKYGLGIKVSNDGYIAMYEKNKSTKLLQLG